MLTSMINHAMYVCIQRHSSNVAKPEISISINQNAKIVYEEPHEIEIFND